MKLERFQRSDDVAARAADLVAEVLAREPAPVLLLPAGRTPEPLYRELVLRHRARELDLGRARLFQLDELVGVGSADPRSFQRFLIENLIAPADLELDERVRLLDGRASDPATEIARHAQALEALGGAHLALVGIGTNGHVAFNEPGSARGARARPVDLAATTRAGLARTFHAGEVPTRGITLGLLEILGARELVLLATGEGKAEVLRRLATRPPSDELPASHLCAHRSFRVLADEAACGLLDQTSPA